MSELVLYQPALVVDDLTAMPRGKAILSVPEKDGTVLIGVNPEAEESGSLTVRRRWRSVTVSNTDGSLLQAAVINEDGSQTEALEEPVPKITFKKRRDLLENRIWYPTGERVSIANKDAMRRFAQVVGKFATTSLGGVIVTKY